MLRKRTATFLWPGAVAFLIVLVGQGLWGVLVAANLKATPSQPWSVLVMTGVLLVMWKYLGGRWWPTRTSETRRRCLRIPVDPKTRPQSACLSPTKQGECRRPGNFSMLRPYLGLESRQKEHT